MSQVLTNKQVPIKYGVHMGQDPRQRIVPAKNKNVWGKCKLSLVEEEGWKGLPHMHAEGFGLHLFRGNGGATKVVSWATKGATPQFCGKWPGEGSIKEAGKPNRKLTQYSEKQ